MVMVTVTTLADGGPSPNDVTLREALAIAQSPGADDWEIGFAPSLAGGTIVLTQGTIGITPAALQTTIDGDIDNDGRPDITIAGDGSTSLFIIDGAEGVAGSAQTFDGVILTGGVANNQLYNGGGAIYARDTSLTIKNSVLSGNVAPGQYYGGGGAIEILRGQLTITGSTIADNVAKAGFDGGGGIYSFETAVTIESSTISGNSTTGGGGKGGGISAREGSLTIVDSTISGNSTSGSKAVGGGVYLLVAKATILDSTIAANVSGASYGGGIATYNSPTSIGNSIIAGNTGSDINGDLFDLAGVYVYSLGGNVTSSEKYIGANDVPVIPSTVFAEVIGPLGDHGGLTQTHALLTGSPAIGIGLPGQLPSGLTLDQRGEPRLTDGKLDSGAFQSQPGALLAIDDTASVHRGGVVEVDPAANDQGALIPGLTLASPPAAGLVLLGAGGTQLYLSSGQPTRGDSYEYDVSDAADGVNRGKVALTIQQADHVQHGNATDDHLSGGNGVDLLFGHGGDDVLKGGAGPDVLFGGWGEDVLRGGIGDDVLRGGQCSDHLTGGDGADVFVLDQPACADRILDFDVAEGDRIVITSAQLLTSDGAVDGTRLAIVDQGGDALLRSDANGDGHFSTLARMDSAAGLSLADALANAIFIA